MSGGTSGGVPILHGSELFTTKQRVSITLSTTVPEYLGVVHSHDFIEIVYVISGSANQLLGERSMRVSKGDLIIVNYQTPHAFLAEKTEQEPFIAYDLAFNPDFLDHSLIADSYFEDIHATFLLSSLLPAPSVNPCINLTGNGFDDFSRLYANMYREYQEKRRGFDDVLRANIVELIVKIYRKLDDVAGNNPGVSKRRMIDTVLEYIHVHYGEHVSLSDIAGRIFLSKDYLNRLVKAETGRTFGAYLQFYRLEQAGRMLRETDETTEHVLEKCGFTDPKFFYASFKKAFGVTPGEYRKRGAFQ